MFPLCTKVTESRLWAMAYSKAALTSRSVPSFETGLIPKLAVWGNLTFLYRSGKVSDNIFPNFSAASVPY